MKETILLFQIDDPALSRALQKALLPLRVRLRKIPEAEYGRTLGELAEQPSLQAASDCQDAGASAPDQPAPLPAPMMIFAGVSDSRLNLILKRLRDCHIFFPYKAVLTPSNQAWTPAQCFQEIRREHEAMSRT